MFLLYSAECHFLFVVFCHSFRFSSDITMFSLKSENIPFGLFQKGPKCCTLHMQVLAQSGACPREWMTEKHGLGAVQAPPPSSAGAGGAGSDAPLWLCSCLLLSKGHSVSPAPGNVGSTPKHLMLLRLAPAGEGSPVWNQLGTSHAKPVWVALFAKRPESRPPEQLC